MQLHDKNFFDFTSFFAWTFLNFLAHCVWDDHQHILILQKIQFESDTNSVPVEVHGHIYLPSTYLHSKRTVNRSIDAVV